MTMQRPTVPVPVWAATRDASWYDRPDTRKVKVFHIATDAETAACKPGPAHVYTTVPLYDGTYTPAHEVYDDLRCRRPGCLRHWRQIPSRPRGRAPAAPPPAEPAAARRPVRIGPPRPRPCASCPYRRDVPSGVWHQAEYDKLREYDLPTGMQPTAVFQCHQNDRHSEQASVCAGWAACHDGDELLALRLAIPLGTMSLDDLEATRDYFSPVAVFASGAQAAEHGEREIDAPGPAALAAQKKIIRVRAMA